MKNELLLGIAVLAVILASMIYFAPGQHGPISGTDNNITEQPSMRPAVESNSVAGRMSHNLIKKGPARNAMESILVYKTLLSDVNKENTLSYAEKFNVTGNIRGETTVQSKDLTYFVTITAISGAVRYANQDRPNIVLDSPGKLPTDDEAKKIATKFLKDRDLYPEGALEPIALRENTYSSKQTITFGRIGVWYPRVLNGLKVEGTQLVVYVGGNGDVIGYFANWRNYEPLKEYPVIHPDEAFDELKVKGIAVGDNPSDTVVSIEDVYLAYHTEAAAFREDYLQPVWVFKGNALVDGKPVVAVQEYIPALPEVPPEFGGPKPIMSVPTTSAIANLTTIPTMTTIVSVNQTATPTISDSPTMNTTSVIEEINQTATLTHPTTTATTNTTSGFNATNGT